MGRIRLQICVLPWDQPGPSPSGGDQTRQETLKWCIACTENTPMQDVCDKIFDSWARMFKAAKGPLKIRHLKTAYGDFVDLEAQVVGDLFDDRGADGNIRNSILEVHRYPPRPDELETLQRFSSLPPNSSARPRKRPLELPTLSFPSQSSQNIYRGFPSIEKWHAETDRPAGTATKRQRTHESRLNSTFHAHHPVRTREEHGDGVHPSPQTSGTQESIHQILDSQKSPGKKHPTPYGTPTSLPLIEESVRGNEIDLSAIPDSPLGRKIISADGALGQRMRLDRESTKSESPELRSSVHEVPSTEPTATSGEQPTSSATFPEPSTTPFIVDSASQPLSIQQIVDEYTKKQGFCVRQTGEKAANINRAPERRPLTANPAFAQNLRSNSKTPDPVFDPISEVECEHDKQQVQDAKCHKSCKEPSTSLTSPHGSDGAGLDRRGHQFLVPLVPQSPTNDARISEPCHDDRPDTDQEAPKSNTISNGVVNAAQTSSQASTAGSQSFKSSTGGIREGKNCVSGQGQAPNETERLDHDASDVGRDPEDSHFAQEAERLPKEAEEQQEEKSISKKKPEEKSVVQETMAKESAAKKKEATKGKANEQRLPDQKCTREQKARTEDSVQAKGAKAKEVEPTEAKPIQKSRVNAGRLAEKKAISEKLARERQIKEAALGEEANRMILAADGAKQIETEKREREKARLQELASAKKANEAKANKQAREAEGKVREKKARKEQLAQSKNSKQRIHQAATAQETAFALKEHGQKVGDREGQKMRDSLEVQTRCSITPSASHNIQGSKRSMTPIVPGYSVTSSSHQDSLGSSPLSNRSSGSMNAPLRSALKQNPNGLRRSVSVSFHVPPPAKLNEYIPSTPKPKSLKENNKDLAIKQLSATNLLPKNPPRTASNAPSTAPVIDLTPKKASDGKITKTPAKNGTVQTKLNVTREVKKLKGRAIERPITPRPPPKQEIVLSSGEDSSTSEDPVWQTGNAKAGPSSRRPNFPVASVQGKKIAKVKSPSTPIDPVILNIKLEKGGTAAPTALPFSSSKADTTAPQKSTSRSPAQALSETFPSSSGSGSSPASASESEFESDSEDGLGEPTSKAPAGAKSGQQAPVATKSFSNAINVGAKPSEGSLQSKASSQSSQASSSRPCSTPSMQRDGKHVDHAADKQLLLESRQSVPKTCIKLASSSINGSADNRVINQGLDHAGRLPNGIRPAYYKYPGLSELQKLPRPVTPVAQPRPDTLREPESDISSSDSDESSSDSDEDEDMNGVSRQTGPKKKSGRYPGMGRVIKLANAVRSKLGPAQQ